MAKKRVSQEAEKSENEEIEVAEMAIDKEVVFLKNAIGAYGFYRKDVSYSIPERLANSFIAENVCIEK
jgi:hypothetical protein